MRAYARAIAEIVDSEYDACYAQGMTGLEMLGGPIPVMVNLHGLDMFFKPHSVKQWLTQRFLRPIAREMFTADAMVSLGGDLTDILAGAGYDRERIVILANGLDPQEIPSEFPIARTKVRDRGILPRFVLVGRYELSKGFDVLCSALDQVDLSIDLDLIGEWPEIEAHPHRIVHHGVVMSRSKLLGLLDAADVLILSSLTEGMPTVILEAMARGLAVVATDVGAVRELVDEQTGWLVPVADSAALAAAIVAAAWSKPEVIHAMGRAAYHRVQEYTWPRIANQTMEARQCH
jgi:glycosyltransferase involved in cell wall biosynthesis